MTAPPTWIGALSHRDPSVALALAALVQSAGPDGTVVLSDLVVAYRETYLRSAAESGTVVSLDLSGDELRGNLTS